MLIASHRQIMNRILDFPPNTRIDWKSHDSSIQQRTAIDTARKEKSNQHNNHHTPGRNAINNNIKDADNSAPIPFTTEKK